MTSDGRSEAEYYRDLSIQHAHDMLRTPHRDPGSVGIEIDDTVPEWAEEETCYYDAVADLLLAAVRQGQSVEEVCSRALQQVDWTSEDIERQRQEAAARGRNVVGDINLQRVGIENGFVVAEVQVVLEGGRTRPGWQIFDVTTQQFVSDAVNWTRDEVETYVAA